MDRVVRDAFESDDNGGSAEQGKRPMHVLYLRGLGVRAVGSRIGRKTRENGMIEPAPLATFGVTRNAFEAEGKLANHSKRSVIVCRGSHANAMRSERLECPLHNGVCGLGHQTLACGIRANPIAQIRGIMQVAERFKAHHTEEPTVLAIANRESTRPTGIPIGGTRSSVAAG
jgi:hypothetical protein